MSCRVLSWHLGVSPPACAYQLSVYCQNGILSLYSVNLKKGPAYFPLRCRVAVSRISVSCSVVSVLDFTRYYTLVFTLIAGPPCTPRPQKAKAQTAKLKC